MKDLTILYKKGTPRPIEVVADDGTMSVKLVSTAKERDALDAAERDPANGKDVDHDKP